MKEEDIRKRDVFDRYLELVEKDVKDFFDFNSFKQITCPACHSNDLSGEFIKLGFDYMSCNRCSTLFVNPRPPFEVLNKFYSSSPSTDFWVKEFFMPVAGARREKIFKPRAEYVFGLFGDISGRIIGDIGAGFGLFLEELKKLLPKNEYIAIEPSLEMAEICRKKGLETICSPLEDVTGSEDVFDCLTAFELMEHLYDPKIFLEKVYSLLKPGGYFLLTTLNGKGFDILLLWDRSKSISPPHHLNFYNPSSISLLLEEIGFMNIEATTPGKLDWDIVEGMMVRDKIDLGRFWDVVAKELNEVDKITLQKWIVQSNLSSHMRVMAQKPYIE